MGDLRRVMAADRALAVPALNGRSGVSGAVEVLQEWSRPAADS
jgi:hypothetical protein